MEANIRTLEDIIAEAQKATAHSLREAFGAGTDHAASELKRRMAVLFEDLAGGPAPGEPARAPHANEAQHSGHAQGQG